MAEQAIATDKQFTITRVFDAPREMVWRAWTDPDEAAIWTHPRGVTTPRDSMQIDARRGGRYAYTMIAPDGTAYPTTGIYREVVPPERLVFTWASPGDDDEHAPVISIHLAVHGDAADQTLMTFHLSGIEGRPGDDNVHDGWSEAFDFLDEHLPAASI